MKTPRTSQRLGVGGFASILAAVLLTLPGLAQAQLSYTTTNGTITITGGCPTSPGALTIPETINGLPVTSVGDRAFSHCKSLTSITIPSSVTNIGNQAFQACTSLTAIEVDPANPIYTSLSGVLFNKGQTRLIAYPGGKTGAYIIPDTVNVIGSYAFSYCASLTSITIPNSVRSIWPWAFWYCTSLASITIPNRVTYLSEWAFAYCTNLTSITIPNSVLYIGASALQGCTRLKGAYFQGNAPDPAWNAFYGATNATVYYLPGTTAWGPNFVGRPTALWTSPFLAPGSVALSGNGFAFTTAWAANTTLVVEACLDLANPAWSPIATNTPWSGVWYFTDPNWTNYPTRFYRVRSP